MLVDFLHNYPIWLVGSVIVALSILVSWLGLYLFGRFVPVSIRREHNDVAGFIIAIVGVIYAVLIAFVAVAVWESFDAADNVVQREANLIGNLLRDIDGVEDPTRSGMSTALREYLKRVITVEWPAQQAGNLADDSKNGWHLITEAQDRIIKFDAKTPSQAVVQAEILRSLNELFSARRARLLAAQHSIPATIWWILILGGMITVAFSFFFGVPSMKMHYAMTGTLAASMALVMVMIISLDWPFRGEVSITADAFCQVQNRVWRGQSPGCPEPSSGMNTAP